MGHIDIEKVVEESESESESESEEEEEESERDEYGHKGRKPSKTPCMRRRCSGVIGLAVSLLVCLLLVLLYVLLGFLVVYPAYAKTSPYVPGLCRVVYSTVRVGSCGGGCAYYVPKFLVDYFPARGNASRNVTAYKNDNNCAEKHYDAYALAKQYASDHTIGTNYTCYQYWDAKSPPSEVYFEEDWCEDVWKLRVGLVTGLVGAAIGIALLVCACWIAHISSWTCRKFCWALCFAIGRTLSHIGGIEDEDDE